VVAALHTLRLIAIGIRDVLRQHGDIFATIEPHEVPGQLIARLPQGGPAMEAYVEGLDEKLHPGPAIVPRHGCLVRDLANLRTLRGHSEGVVHVVILPGERALSASWDTTLRLWDLASGETLRVLDGHADQVTHVAALPGERALSASRDNTLRLWDLASGETLRVLDDQVGAGKVRYIGVSNFKGWQVMKALGLSDASHWTRFVAAQYQYSLINRDIEDEFSDLCPSEGIGITAWGPLGGGFLSGKYQRNQRPQAATEGRIATTGSDAEEAWERRNTERNWAVLEAVQAIAQAHGATVAQVATANTTTAAATATPSTAATTTTTLTTTVRTTTRTAVTSTKSS